MVEGLQRVLVVVQIVANARRGSGMSQVIDDGLIDAVGFDDECPLEDDSGLFVPLRLLGGELVHPAQLGVAVLAVDVPDHVSAGEHDPVLDVAVVEVDHLVEEEGPARGPREAGGDEFASVGQESVALRARKEFSASDVLKVNPTHYLLLFINGALIESSLFLTCLRIVK